MNLLAKVQRCLCVLLVCLACSGCAQAVQSKQQVLAQPSATPTEDPITLNICATCDVQQRRIQATAAAAD